MTQKFYWKGQSLYGDKTNSERRASSGLLCFYRKVHMGRSNKPWNGKYVIHTLEPSYQIGTSIIECRLKIEASVKAAYPDCVIRARP